MGVGNMKKCDKIEHSIDSTEFLVKFRVVNMGDFDKSMYVWYVWPIRQMGKAIYKKLEWKKCQFKVPTKTISEHSIHCILLYFYDYSQTCT